MFKWLRALRKRPVRLPHQDLMDVFARWNVVDFYRKRAVYGDMLALRRQYIETHAEELKVRFKEALFNSTAGKRANITAVDISLLRDYWYIVVSINGHGNITCRPCYTHIELLISDLTHLEPDYEEHA